MNSDDGGSGRGGITLAAAAAGGSVIGSVSGGGRSVQVNRGVTVTGVTSSPVSGNLIKILKF